MITIATKKKNTDTDMFQTYYPTYTERRKKVEEESLQFEMKCRPKKITKLPIYEDPNIFKMFTDTKYFTCPYCRKYIYDPITNKKKGTMTSLSHHEETFNYECSLCAKRFIIMRSDE